MSILGNRVVRVEDPRLLTDGGTYVDDLPVDGALHAVSVRSTVANAHARVSSVDAARAAPAVVDVVTAADLDLAPFPRDVERFVGEAVANPLGAKGIGESGTIGSTAAVQQAVVDALAHLGIRHLDVPATPERVWRAVCDASG